MKEKIKIKVVPGSRENEVKSLAEGYWKVKLQAVPQRGKANRELIAILAEYFGVKKNALAIIKGEFSREKVIEIDRGGD